MDASPSEREPPSMPDADQVRIHLQESTPLMSSFVSVRWQVCRPREATTRERDAPDPSVGDLAPLVAAALRDWAVRDLHEENRVLREENPTTSGPGNPLLGSSRLWEPMTTTPTPRASCHCTTC